MGICYTLFLYARNDEARGNTQKTQNWPMDRMCGNRNQKRIMVNPHKEKFAHEKFYGNIPDYAKYLRNFG